MGGCVVEEVPRHPNWRTNKPAWRHQLLATAWDCLGRRLRYVHGRMKRNLKGNDMRVLLLTTHILLFAGACSSGSSGTSGMPEPKDALDAMAGIGDKPAGPADLANARTLGFLPSNVHLTGWDLSQAGDSV